jgi:hypothetical protein
MKVKHVGLLSAAALLLAACGGGSSDSGSTSNSAANTASAPNATVHKITGSVSHLAAAGLTLSNGTDTLSIDASSTSFSFPTAVAEGAAYDVKVASHPANQHCEATNGAGKIAKADASDIVIACHTQIAKTTTVGVHTTQDPPRVFLPLTMIGDRPVKMNTILDTGSSGALLNATEIFPSSMFDGNGDFIFPQGKDKLTWKGITVTNVRARKDYGHGTHTHYESGFLGYAQITMGAHGELTSGVVPILFVTFSSDENSLYSASANLSVNIFGINPSIEKLSFDGITKLEKDDPVPVCKDVPSVQCALLNPLRSIHYAADVDAGFALGPFALQACDIGKDACPVDASFKVGLEAAQRASYNAVGLTCTDAHAADGTAIPNCDMQVSGVTATVNGARYFGNLVVDSGQPDVRVTVLDTAAPTIVPFQTISFAFPGGFSYSFSVADSGPYATYANSSTNREMYSNAGIEFFFAHSMMIDFGTSQEGWK